jgi:hypothetical protein
VLEERIVVTRERVPRLGRDVGDALYDLDFYERSLAGAASLAIGLTT